MTDQMEQVEKVADVLKNWRKYSSPESTRGRSHSGLKYIKGNEEVAAKRILQRNWNGRMVVSSMFKMAQYVESALDLKLKWLERYHLARLLISSLTFAGIYKLEKEDEDDWFKPYIIHSLVGHESPEDRPSFKTRIGKPFPKWTSNVDRWGNVLVKSSKGCPPELEHQPQFFRTEDYPVDSAKRYQSIFLEAVHKLERISFRINEELLDLVIELDKNPDTRIIHDTPPDDVLEEREQKLVKLYDQFDMDTVNAKWQAHPSSKIEEIDTMGDDEKSRHQRYHKQKYLIEEWKESYTTRRKRFLEEIEQAKELRGKVFYQRVKVGHNGRIYFPEGLSYQGSDFARAVIEFADGVRVSDEGASFIHLHAINQYGEKGDIDLKMEAGDRLSLACAYVALDPVENVELWADADKPYCYLRVCQDIIGLWPKYADQKLNDSKQVFKMNSEEEGFYRSIVARGNKQNGRFVFESHLPIELDQSNSAFAHIGLLMRDEELQKKAGMDQEWSDVYSDIAESVNLGDTNEVTSPISWGKTGFIVDEDRVAASGPDKGETRKIIKSISVPWSYGAGEKTCGDALVKLRNEDPDKFPYLWTLDSIEKINDLAGDVIEVLETEFDACVKYKQRIQNAVTTAKKLGKDCVEYLSPFGFQVVHRKYGAEKRKDEVWSGEKWIQPVAYRPTKPSWSELRTSTPAILVHSLDAALIHGILALGMMTIESGEDKKTLKLGRQELVDAEKNRFPIITIHDCFACHASVAPEMQRMLLNGLAAMYRELDPLNLFLSTLESTEFEPQNRETAWESWAKNAFG